MLSDSENGLRDAKFESFEQHLDAFRSFFIAPFGENTMQNKTTKKKKKKKTWRQGKKQLKATSKLVWVICLIFSPHSPGLALHQLSD